MYFANEVALSGALTALPGSLDQTLRSGSVGEPRPPEASTLDSLPRPRQAAARPPDEVLDDASLLSAGCPPLSAR